MSNACAQVPSQSSLTAQQVSPDTRPMSLKRILYFAPKECWPPSTGAQLRNFYLAREMSRGAHVTYIGFSDGARLSTQNGNAHDPATDGTGAKWCERAIIVPRDSGYQPMKIIRGAFGPTPLPVLNYTTRTMAEALKQLLNEEDFDIVQVEGVHLTAYLPIIRAARSKPLAVCDWHNIESELMWRYSERSPSVAHRLYARTTARRMAEMEGRAARDFDVHLVVSDRDRLQVLEYAPEACVFVIENGVNVEYYSDKWNSRSAAPASQNGAKNPGASGTRRHRIVFVGLMDYHANVDAAVYFAHEIWPLVHQRRPDLTFTIVGRNPAPKVSALADLPGIEVTGSVQDVRPYCREAVAAVVPLRVGGGSRLKILEAMASGLPVVSTTLGAEGLAVRNGENIVLADTSDDFSRALLAICEDEATRQKLAEAGRQLVREHYDWPVLGATLLDTYLKLTSSSDRISH